MNLQTKCTADPEGSEVHDYTQPPHNTPAKARLITREDPCYYGQYRTDCERERKYEITIYQRGTHDWVVMYACESCTAVIRERHHDRGPWDPGSRGIARVRLASQVQEDQA